jgi:hypothetical protein
VDAHTRAWAFVHVGEVTARYRRHAAQVTAGPRSGPIRLVECSWQLRLREERALAADAARPAAEVHAWLRDALDSDLREAWHAGQADAFTRLLEISAGTPWLKPVAARWRLRALLGWKAGRPRAASSGPRSVSQSRERPGGRSPTDTTPSSRASGAAGTARAAPAFASQSSNARRRHNIAL